VDRLPQGISSGGLPHRPLHFDLASNAALRAMKKSGVSPRKSTSSFVATITPDMPFPSTACLVQQKIRRVPRAGSKSRPRLRGSSTD